MKGSVVRRWLWRIGSAVLAVGCVLGAFWLLCRYMRENRTASAPAELIREESGETAREEGVRDAGDETGKGTETTRSARDGIAPGIGKEATWDAGDEIGKGTEAETAQNAGDGTGEAPGDTEKEASRSEGTETVSRGELPIRVHILGDHYKGNYHDSVKISASGGLAVEVFTSQTKEGQTRRLSGSSWDAQEEELSPGDYCILSGLEGGPLVIESLERAQGSPEYAGSIYVYREEEGYLLVNELLLEEYLCGVVSSEMPSYYPEEAQKAQAVCARTYALHCMEARRGEAFWEKESGDQEAEYGPGEEKSDIFLSDLDDSVAFQVYNNQKTSKTSREAVEATAGQFLPVKEVLYYSTSCQTEHREDLAEEEAFWNFLLAEPEADQEYGSPWLRWQVRVPKSAVLAAVWEDYGFTGEEVEHIEAAAREKDGQVTELLVSGDGQSVTVDGEYNIRQVLSPEETAVYLRDGTKMSGMTLLPSAYFCVRDGEAGGDSFSEEDDGGTGTSGEEAFFLYGGGYGHGKGMSQCGAAAMAAAGADYREILEYYYGNDGLKTLIPARTEE